jgi:hypothetical protein
MYPVMTIVVFVAIFLAGSWLFLGCFLAVSWLFLGYFSAASPGK